MIDPWWPLAILAAIQLGDAVLYWKPVAFVRDCLWTFDFRNGSGGSCRR